MGLLKKVILGIGVSIALIATLYAHSSFANSSEETNEYIVDQKVKKYQLLSELKMKENNLLRTYLYENNPSRQNVSDISSSYIYLVDENDQLIFKGDSDKIDHLLDESALITTYNNIEIMLYMD